MGVSHLSSRHPLIPTLLFAHLGKVYIRLMVVCTVWLGTIGFIDDYLKYKAKRIALKKVFRPKRKATVMALPGGLKFWTGDAGNYCCTYFTPSVVVKREVQ